MVRGHRRNDCVGHVVVIDRLAEGKRLSRDGAYGCDVRHICCEMKVRFSCETVDWISCLEHMQRQDESKIRHSRRRRFHVVTDLEALRCTTNAAINV